MQEFRNTLRKVAAIGASVAMLGMTVTGALAADLTLADYPTPFKNGGNTLVIYGDASTGADTAAAAELVLGLPAVATTTATTTTATTTNAGSVELDNKHSRDVVLGTTLNDSTLFGNAITDSNLAGLKRGQFLFGANGGTYDYHESLLFNGNAFLGTGLSLASQGAASDSFGTNIVLYLPSGSVTYNMTFDSSLVEPNFLVNATTSQPFEIPFLGKTLQLRSGGDVDTISAIAGDKFSMEAMDSVVVAGKKVIVTAIGITSARIDVDGVSDTFNVADTKTLNGLSVNLKDLLSVGADNNAGKSSVTIIVSDAKVTSAVKSYDTGTGYIGQDKYNALWNWNLGALTAAKPTLGITLAKSLISSSLSGIPDYPLSHPPYVGDLFCLPNNYVCLTIESISQSDDSMGTYQVTPQTLDLYNAGGTATDHTSAHVLAIKSLDTANGLGLNVAGTGLTSTSTKEVYLYLNSTSLGVGQKMKVYAKDTTTSKPLYVGILSPTDGKMNLTSGGGFLVQALGSIEYKSSSLPLGLVFVNATDLAGTLPTGTWSTGNAFNTTGITNGVSYAQMKLVVGDVGATVTSDTGDSLQIYFRESDTASRLDSLGHKFTQTGSIGSYDMLYIPGTSNSVVDASGYLKDSRMKSGVIVSAPKTSLESNNMITLKVPVDASNYKAKVTIATTKGGAKATVEKGKVAASSSITMKDSDVKDVTLNDVIVVGGPAVNKIAAQLLGKEFPAYGANSGLKEGEAVIQLSKQTSGKYALLVAGWEADDTKRAGLVLKNFDKFKAQLKGNSVTVKGTDMLVEGFTVA